MGLVDDGKVSGVCGDGDAGNGGILHSATQTTFAFLHGLPSQFTFSSVMRS